MLGRAIKDLEGVVAMTAIESLFAMKGADAADTIREGLRHSNPDVVRVTEKILSKIAK